MAGIDRAQAVDISRRSSIHFSAFFSASARSGRMCTVRTRCAIGQHQEEIAPAEQLLDPSAGADWRSSRPPTNSSSIPCSGGIFLNGFFA